MSVEDQQLSAVYEELQAARAKFGPFHGAHEGT
jgi:hypothetical protein